MIMQISFTLYLCKFINLPQRLDLGLERETLWSKSLTDFFSPHDPKNAFLVLLGACSQLVCVHQLVKVQVIQSLLPETSRQI